MWVDGIGGQEWGAQGSEPLPGVKEHLPKGGAMEPGLESQEFRPSSAR